MIEQARREAGRIAAWLMVKEPFLGLLLRRTTIVASGGGVAHTDGIRIYVNPEEWLALPEKDRAAVLVHELMHIVLLHVPRVKELMARYPLPPWVYNFVTDAKANQEIIGPLFPPLQLTWRPIMPEDVEQRFSVKGAKEKSLEEIIKEIYEKEVQRAGEAPPPSSPQDLQLDGGSEQRGEVIQEGDEPAGRGLTAEEIKAAVARKVVEAVVTLKTAGIDPGKWDRLAAELLKPRADWRGLLRPALQHGVGRAVRRTWSRPSRKAPGLYPGKELLGHGKVVFLIDVSGSIGDRELSQFLTEAYAAAKEVGRIVVVTWDAKVQGEFALTRHSDIRKIKVKGGGGTAITPALRHVLEKHKDAALYVILSDWEISDLDKAREVLEEIAPRTIAVTTSRPPPPLPFLKVIRLE
ncbi:MAG: VWA-like domain-containing protein [Pyrobaculum sp.]